METITTPPLLVDLAPHDTKLLLTVDEAAAAAGRSSQDRLGVARACLYHDHPRPLLPCAPRHAEGRYHGNGPSAL